MLVRLIFILIIYVILFIITCTFPNKIENCQHRQKINVLIFIKNADR